MSAEVFAIVVSAVGMVLTLGTSIIAGGAWIVRRIDAVDTNLSARIDAVEEKLTARIDALAAEVTDVKVAVTRLEGPRHLVPASR